MHIPKLTYANVVSTLALFLVLGSGAAFAADSSLRERILGMKNVVSSKSVQPKAVEASDLAPDSVKSAKIKDGSIHAEDIGPRARVAAVADGSVTTTKLADGSVTPAKMQTPVSRPVQIDGAPEQVLHQQPQVYDLGPEASFDQPPEQVLDLYGQLTTTSTFQDRSGFGMGCSISVTLFLNGSYLTQVGTSNFDQTKESRTGTFQISHVNFDSTAEHNVLTAQLNGFDCSDDSQLDDFKITSVAVG